MQMYPPAPQHHYGQPVYPQAGVPPYSPAFQGVSVVNNVLQTNQAIPGQYNQGAVNNIQWSTGLCGCFQDCGNCCLTCWCPCVTVGRIVEVVDKGTTSCTLSAIIYTALACVGIPCLYSYGFRTKLRNLYSLKESCCGDCCLHCWCECCAICQEYRELKNRGVDPSIGWQGNVRKWNRAGLAMPPPVAAGMYR